MLAGRGGPGVRRRATSARRRTAPAVPATFPTPSGWARWTQQGQVAPFSSRGPVNWTGAIERQFRQAGCGGAGGGDHQQLSRRRSTASLSGSSQAAPIVAGAVAVMREPDPDSSVPDIKQALYRVPPTRARRTTTGYGLINLPGALGKLGVQLASGAGRERPPRAEAAAGPQPVTLLRSRRASECKFSGQKQVAFGAAGRYLSGLTTDGFRCTVAEWGSDPVPGGQSLLHAGGETVIRDNAHSIRP